MGLPPAEPNKVVQIRYDEPMELLQAIYEGVKELGSGAVVLPSYDPEHSPPSFGFVLTPRSPDERSWWLYIPISVLKETFHVIPDALWDCMKTTEGRVELAFLLTEGCSPGHIAALLSDTIVSYIRQKISKLEAQAKAERAKLPVADGAIFAHMNRNGHGHGLPGDAATLRAAALRELVRDLASGRHLK
jgi:hypothetical protein